MMSQSHDQCAAEPCCAVRAPLMRRLRRSFATLEPLVGRIPAVVDYARYVVQLPPRTTATLGAAAPGPLAAAPQATPAARAESTSS